jgi:hypothetical protein
LTIFFSISIAFVITCDLSVPETSVPAYYVQPSRPHLSAFSI